MKTISALLLLCLLCAPAHAAGPYHEAMVLGVGTDGPGRLRYVLQVVGEAKPVTLYSYGHSNADKLIMALYAHRCRWSVIIEADPDADAVLKNIFFKGSTSAAEAIKWLP